jgi:hypothetical protein
VLLLTFLNVHTLDAMITAPVIPPAQGCQEVAQGKHPHYLQPRYSGCCLAFWGVHCLRAVNRLLRLGPLFFHPSFLHLQLAQAFFYLPRSQVLQHLPPPHSFFQLRELHLLDLHVLNHLLHLRLLFLDSHGNALQQPLYAVIDQLPPCLWSLSPLTPHGCEGT